MNAPFDHSPVIVEAVATDWWNEHVIVTYAISDTSAANIDLAARPNSVTSPETGRPAPAPDITDARVFDAPGTPQKGATTRPALAQTVEMAELLLRQYGMSRVHLDATEAYFKSKEQYSEAVASSMSAAGRTDWDKLNKALDETLKAGDEVQKARADTSACLDQLKHIDPKLIELALDRIEADESIDRNLKRAIRQLLRR